MHQNSTALKSQSSVARKGEPIQPIPPGEIEPHPFSTGDPGGQLFRWHGSLYRGIRPGHEDLYRSLASTGLLDEWSQAGFVVPTRLTANLRMDAFSLILEHREIQPVSLPAEWPPVMLRDAVLHTLDFAIELTRHGLIIKDPHPWNTVFDRTQPLYVDLTSIIRRPEGTIWPGYRNFTWYCQNPLILISHGYDQLARLLMEEDQGVSSEIVERLTGLSVRHPFRSWERSLRRAGCAVHLVKPEDDTLVLLRRLRERVKAIPLDESRPVSEHLPTTAEYLLLERIRKSSVRSVLDFNCTASSLPLELASAGFRVTTLAADPAIATSLYRSAQQRGCDIVSVFMDFLQPTPGRGLANSRSIPAELRFRAELGLVRGLSRQMLEEKRVRPQHLADGLVGFDCRRFLIHWAGTGDESNGEADRQFLTSLADRLRKHLAAVTLIDEGNSTFLECAR